MTFEALNRFNFFKHKSIRNSLLFPTIYEIFNYTFLCILIASRDITIQTEKFFGTYSNIIVCFSKNHDDNIFKIWTIKFFSLSFKIMCRRYIFRPISFWKRFWKYHYILLSIKRILFILRKYCQINLYWNKNSKLYSNAFPSVCHLILWKRRVLIDIFQRITFLKITLFSSILQFEKLKILKGK